MNDATTVYRQIHPSFVQAGFPTSQAFRPTPKDESKLSVYDGDLIAPENAFQHYVNQLCLASDGVMGLTVAECTTVSLAVCSDPEPFPEHALIDFSGLPDKDCRTKSKILRMKAVQRGWLHRAS
jgi:hypothetical protein